MYAQQRECPDCGKQVSESSKKCTCGWEPSKFLGGSNFSDQICKFIFNGERCRLPGSMCSSIQKSDDWKCKYHFEMEGNNFESGRWLTFINENFKDIIHYRKHYFSNIKNCQRCAKFVEAEKMFSESKNEGEELSFSQSYVTTPHKSKGMAPLASYL